MLPSDLKPEQFAGYPPEARKLVTNYLGTLRQLPLSFVPSLLRELIDYDFKFPAERKAREKELANLSSLSPDRVKELFQAFVRIRLSPDLEAFDWAKSPVQFVERLSAYLWSTHQLDAFRKASTGYADHLRSAVPQDLPAIPRLGITVIGQGVASYEEPLFRKLRAHGAYFSGVKPEDGFSDCWMQSLRAQSRILLPTAIGTSMVVKRPITPRRLLSSPTSLSNRRAPHYCAGCNRNSIVRAWDLKRFAHFWPSCALRISVWTERAMTTPETK